MKTVKRKSLNKTVLIILILLIVGTSLTGLAMAKGEQKEDVALVNEDYVENIEVINDNSGERADYVTVPTEILNSAPNNSAQSEESEIDETKEKIERIKEQSIQLRSNRLRTEDTFNYTKEDIERLLLGGATVEDIYLSDQIANEWLVDPDQLIALKQQSSATWDEIASAIQSDKEARLDELIALYPVAEEEFSELKMNVAEKVEVLEILHESTKDEVKQESLDRAIEQVSNNENTREQAYLIPYMDIQEEANR